MPVAAYGRDYVARRARAESDFRHVGRWATRALGPELPLSRFCRQARGPCFLSWHSHRTVCARGREWCCQIDSSGRHPGSARCGSQAGHLHDQRHCCVGRDPWGIPRAQDLPVNKELDSSAMSKTSGRFNISSQPSKRASIAALPPEPLSTS